MSTDKTAVCFCPACGRFLDSATDPFGDARPKDGDLSLCIACGTVLVFNADLTVSRASKDILDDLPTEQLIQIAKIRRAIVRINNEH